MDYEKEFLSVTPEHKQLFPELNYREADHLVQDPAAPAKEDLE